MEKTEKISRRGFVQTSAIGMAGIMVSPFSTLSPFEAFSAPDSKNLLMSKFITVLDIGGVMGQRLKANLENWELTAYKANPAMVEMFYDRDREPSRNPNAWSGEFVGKYLCASIRSYQLLRDPRQKQLIENVANKLINSQDEDGYLGPFNKEMRLTGHNTWDFWGHQWVIRALLLYYEEFNSEKALNTARKSADMIVEKFLNGNFHFTNDEVGGAVNYAIIHSYTQLYIITGDESYLEMAKWIEKEWELPESKLKYISKTSDGLAMYEFGHPATRWESLHDFLGIHEMYLITGEKKYYNIFVDLWEGIQKNDIHNTGGFTTGEVAIGDPYNPGAIETCCTVAWIDMSTKMLKLTANSTVADEIELSTYNGLLGSQHPSGRWWTFNTPMDGVKEASAHSIVFQARPGSPELNCCSVNGPRGLSLLTQWALLKSDDGVVVNFYGQSEFEVQTPKNKPLQVTQITNYPTSGDVLIKINLETPESFPLKFRIPSWSAQTIVKVNEKPVQEVKEGTYLEISRTWEKDDKVEIEFDMTPHYWTGAGAAEGKTSIYYGPLLLAFDPVYNNMDPHEIPEFSAKNIKFSSVKTTRLIQPIAFFSIYAIDGKEINLVDFATAGAYGNKYVTWLPIKGVGKKPSDPLKPLWTNRNLSG